ncbi:MAG: tetratricopeptide repeat protein [Planctomycetaceae bacterium]|nr:tetratricopeptide repeat protein [Planctomycetaceae bacterium]
MSSAEDIAKLCWQKGSQAINSENFDYATEMFHKSVMLVPNNLAYRQSLRTSAFKKYKNNLKGAGMMSRPKMMKIKAKLSLAKSKKKWDEVDKIAEEGLLINPWDSTLNATVGDACHRRDYNTVAVFAYQVAVGPGGDPENINLQREFAQLLQTNEQFQEAAVVWKRVHKLNPNDGDARSNVTACEFEHARVSAGFDDASSTRDVMPAHEISKKLRATSGKQNTDAPGMDPEKDLQHAIRKDPKSIELYLKLAELYKDKGQLEQAKQTYQQAYELSDSDQNIKELIEDLELKELESEIKIAKNDAQASPDDQELKKQVGKLSRTLLDREIKVFAERTVRYPQNKRIKFDLAKRYHRLKRWSDAIPLYQQASLDPRVEVESLASLGKCFLQDNKPKLAERQFVKSLPKLSYEENEELFKDVHYYLGRIYEQAKQPKKSEDHYGEILAVDYDYKDVRTRLEKLSE